MSKNLSIDTQRISEDFSLSEKDFVDMNAVLSKLRETGELCKINQLLESIFEAQRNFVTKKLASIQTTLQREEKEAFNFKKQLKMNGDIFTRNFNLITRILIKEVSDRVFELDSEEDRREETLNNQTEQLGTSLDTLLEKQKARGKDTEQPKTFTVNLDKKETTTRRKLYTVPNSQSVRSPSNQRYADMDKKNKSSRSQLSTSLNKSCSNLRSGMSYHTSEIRVPDRNGYQYVDSEFSYITGSPLKFSKKDRFDSSKNCSPGPMHYNKMPAEVKTWKSGSKATIGNSIRVSYFDENKENYCAPGPKYCPSKHFTSSITRGKI